MQDVICALGIFGATLACAIPLIILGVLARWIAYRGFKKEFEREIEKLMKERRESEWN